MTAIARVDELEIFVATAAAGSLSRAARELRLPVTSVSRKLARLEERLSTVLITRTTRRMKLTRDGERLLVRARHILDEVAAAERELVHGEEPNGTLRLAVPTLMTQFGLLDELLRVSQRHPELNVELLVQDTPIDLVASGCDAAVVAGRPPASSHKLVPLGVLSAVLAASEGYIERAGMPTLVSDLKRHACLRFAGPEPQTHWPLIGPTKRKRRVRIGNGLASNNSRVLYEAMLQGAGIGLAAEQALRKPHLKLRRVLDDYRHAPLQLFALCAQGPRGSPHTRFAIDMLKRGFNLAG